MTVREIHAKTILRKYRQTDSWFLTRYGMNLYRGCRHNCVYCDGRSEKYQVEGEFGRHLEVKINALDILKRELDPARKRVPMTRCYMMLGGGVGDAYQPAEADYRLARGALSLLRDHRWPVHILTKSALIKRDADLIKQIHERHGVLLSFSFSSVDPELGALFEPGLPPPLERLETIRFFKKMNIPCGIFLMPVIPFISDSVQQMTAVLEAAQKVNADYIIFGGMTLKPGRQQAYVMDVVRNRFPEKEMKYNRLYPGSPWGGPTGKYQTALHQRFYQIIKSFNLPVRIPFRFYKDILKSEERVRVVLEHIDYLYRLRGVNSEFGTAVYALSKMQIPLSDALHSDRLPASLTRRCREVIAELLKTGRSSLLETLMNLQKEIS